MINIHFDDFPTSLVKEGERVDDLQLEGLKIIQNPKLYAFTSDAVFLANFVSGVKDKVVADLGTGSGIIPILITKKQSPKRVYGIELQPCMADMAARSVEYNGMKSVIEIINRDMLESSEFLGIECVDVAVCNPPYRKSGSGDVQSEPSIAMCRHEITITLEQVVAVASQLLKNNGSFFIVHRVERMAELFHFLKLNELEPKEIKFSDNNKFDTFALKAVKRGNIGLKIIIK